MNDDLNKEDDKHLNERLLESPPSKDLMRRFDIDDDFKSGERLETSPAQIKFASSPPNIKLIGFGGNTISPAPGS